MDDQTERAERISLLRRLSPVELVVLRERCRGMTSPEIAAALDVSGDDAVRYLGNVYDRLEVTYGREGTSMGRLMAFCPLLDDPDAPMAPVLSAVNARDEPPPQQPSGHALELVRSDDETLRVQRGLDSRGGAGGSNWWYLVAAGLAILLIAILVAFLLIGDDDDDDADATATAAAEQTAAAIVPTEEPEPTEPPTDTPAPEEPTATPEAPTETPSPSPEPTETPSPSPTEEPPATEAPDATPTPAVTPTPAPTNTPAPEPPPLPAPLPGDEVFAADWEAVADEWQFGDAWTVEAGALTATGPDAGPAIATFEPETADYAVQAVMTIESLDTCEEMLVGVFGRVTTMAVDGEDFPAGYIAGVCEGEWRIEAIEEEENQRDELASGALETELAGEPHTMRFELTGDTLRFFIDNEFVGEATDDRYTDPGQTGVYFDGETQVAVEEFTVEELQPE